MVSSCHNNAPHNRAVVKPLNANIRHATSFFSFIFFILWLLYCWFAENCLSVLLAFVFFQLRLFLCFVFLPPTTEEVNAFARDVCLSVCYQDYSKKRAWIWMTFCISTGVGTWTNWLTFERDPDHSPDAGTGLLSAISMHCNAEFYYVGKISRTDVQVLDMVIGRPSQQRRVVLRRRNTVVGGKCTLPSALVVFFHFFSCTLCTIS